MEILISKDLLFGIGLLLFHALVPSPCLASISVEGREAEGAKECSNDLPEFKMSVDAFMEVASSANHKRYSGDFQGSCRVNQSRCFSFLFAIDLTFRVEPHRVRQRPVTDLS